MNFNKIFEKLKKNFPYLILVLVIIIVSILVYIYLENEKASDVSYDISLGEYEQKTDSWDNLIFLEEADVKTVNNLPIYKARIANDSEIEDIVESLGFNLIQEEPSEFEEFRIWSVGDSFARFDSESGDFVADFSNEPLVLDRMSDLEISDEESELEEYFNAFVFRYLAFSGSFNISYDINTEDKVFRITGIETLNGNPINKAFGQNFSVAAEFNGSGALLNLYSSMIFFTETRSERLMTFDELKRSIYLSDFPKEAFTYAKTESDSCSGDDCDEYGFYSFEGFRSAVISSAELAYYFDLNKSTEVTPVYQLWGDAVVKAQDGIYYDVDVKVLANALDLKIVGTD